MQFHSGEPAAPVVAHMQHVACYGLGESQALQFACTGLEGVFQFRFTGGAHIPEA